MVFGKKGSASVFLIMITAVMFSLVFAYITAAGKIFDCAALAIELVLVITSDGAFAWLVKFVGVHLADQLAVDLDRNLRSLAFDFYSVPLAGPLGSILGGWHKVVDRTEVVATGSVAGCDLSLETGVHGIGWILDAKENSRVAGFGHLDVTLQDKVAELLFINDDVATRFVGLHRMINNVRCNFFAVIALPTCVVGSVEQKLPPGLLLLFVQLIVSGA